MVLWKPFELRLVHDLVTAPTSRKVCGNGFDHLENKYMLLKPREHQGGMQDQTSGEVLNLGLS